MRTQPNSDISVRYDPESDYVQLYNGSQWIDWKIAGLLFDGYLIKNGVINTSHFGNGFDIFSENANITYHPGYIKFGTKNDGILKASSKKFEVTGYSKISIEYYLTSVRVGYYDVAIFDISTIQNDIVSYKLPSTAIGGYAITKLVQGTVKQGICEIPITNVDEVCFNMFIGDANISSANKTGTADVRISNMYLSI